MRHLEVTLMLKASTSSRQICHLLFLQRNGCLSDISSWSVAAFCVLLRRIWLHLYPLGSLLILRLKNPHLQVPGTLVVPWGTSPSTAAWWKPCCLIMVLLMVLLIATAVKWVWEEKNEAPQTLAGTAVCCLWAFSVISLKSARDLPIRCNISTMRIKA